MDETLAASGSRFRWPALSASVNAKIASARVGDFQTEPDRGFLSRFAQAARSQCASPASCTGDPQQALASSDEAMLGPFARRL